MIVGVPSNDFGAQEPGGATEIAQTAQHQYGVTFPMAAKVVVKGADAHPFYRWAASARPKDVPRWNFHKYLVGRDRYIAEAFPETVEPLDTRVRTAIARALADSWRNASNLAARLPKLTGSTDISTGGEKAVAVAALVQLGYDDRGREIARSAGKRRGLRTRSRQRKTTCILRQV